LKIVVVGSRGFIGKNLCVTLREHEHEVLEAHSETSQDILLSHLAKADFVFHLAGINRTNDIADFQKGNVELTKFIVDSLIKFGRDVPLVFSSSTQAVQDNPYGKSKFEAEQAVQLYSECTLSPHYIYRFPNVFGKWCRPNYNSFVSTFCYNIINGIEISVNDASAVVNLVYIDDVCASLISLLDGKSKPGFHSVPNEFLTTVGKVAEIIRSFEFMRDTLGCERVGEGLVRALYSTFLSFVPPARFSYRIPVYADNRGVFAEVLKTRDSGQFSFFTAHPGITRGGHYHHTKNEKFLVIKGTALFKFENIATGDRYELCVIGSTPEIVETIPGWAHDITNTGDDDLIVMLWANEIFDPKRPDTIARLL
jgi:UDP-2-acetamido-2,6-beta-L-arabino-hexul-4-ose reductase